MRGHSVTGAARFHSGLGAFLAWWGWRWGALAAYRDALRADPGFAEAHLRIGEALSRQGRWHEASLAFLEAVRLQGTNLEAHGNLVLALSRAGRGAEAVRALERVIRLRPYDAEPHILLGALLRKLGRRAEAIRAFRWAVRLGPSPRWSRFFLGEALLGRRGWSETLGSYHLARRLSPGVAASSTRLAAGRSCLNNHPGEWVLDPSSSSRRGTKRRRRPERRSASQGLVGLARRIGTAIAAAQSELQIQLRREVFSRSPHLALRSLRQRARPQQPARTRLAWAALLPLLLSGQAHAESPEAREAARQCTQLVREAGVAACREALSLGVSPQRSAVVLEALAIELAGLERWDEVVATYRELVRLRPEDADAHLRLGDALLYGQGALEQAVVSLEESIRLRPEARAWGALGAAWNGLERHEQALRAFEEALRLDPDYFEFRRGSRQTFEASQRGERWPR